MFLIFTLGRLNVLADTDLGIRKGIMLIYGLNDLPTFEQVRQISRKIIGTPITLLPVYTYGNI
jgi:3-methyladenine DNA glycosylase/8-oxoguanine DNA glycosylase